MHHHEPKPFRRTADAHRKDLLLMGKGERLVYLRPAMANRHGLIAGATGTGKTVTLQVLAEAFSRLGVPVFLVDVKGDLSGLAAAGTASPKISDRLQRLGLSEVEFEASPVEFWDVFGAEGLPARTTITELGPLLLGRLLGLNGTQQDVLSLVFRLADDEGWLLLDLKDLRASLQHVAANSKALRRDYGHVAAASVGAIQRRLLALEEQGADQFFGEPALALSDLMRTAANGRGVINILAANQLLLSPSLYATFLLWLMAELFEELPEAGDLERPKLVLFLDEAHLVFDDAPKVLLDQVEQVVRLIRSKGVGVYFITQSPLDIPVTVLGQLGNRVQHALRAYTPRDQKAVRTAAETFRPNPAFDTVDAITNLGLGEALISTLDDQGRPEPVERTLIRPPCSQIGPINTDRRAALIRGSGLGQHYARLIDRESAYEVLLARAQSAAPSELPSSRSIEARGSGSAWETMLKSTARTVGQQLGRHLVRGILGALSGRRYR